MQELWFVELRTDVLQTEKKQPTWLLGPESMHLSHLGYFQYLHHIRDRG